MQNRHAYVSQKEINLPSGTVLITKTDTRGVITYCNDAFVAISGYSREELIGKSHNIVRHPDMPAQVFELLWDTLKTDRPWRGLIKNRCKNGDHYWVRSTVAPIIEDGKITGYVSVRKPPSRAQISEAENQYRQLAQSDAKLVSKYERYKFKHWSLAAKLQFLIQSTLLIILSGAQLYVSDNLREESRASAEDKGDQIANEIIDSANMLMITGQISEEKNRKLLLKKIMSSGGVTSAQLVRAPQVVAQFGPGLPEEHVTDDIQRRAIESRQQVVTYSRDENGYPRVRIVTPYVVSHDFHGTDCMTCHNVQDGSVNGASDITIDLKADYQRIHSMEMATIVGQIALHVFMFLFISYITKRFVGRPFRDVRAEFRNIMQGNLDTELDISVRDDTGILLCEIQSMQVYLRTVVDEIVTPVVKIQGSIEGLDARVASVAANAVMEHDHILSIAATMDQFSHSVSDVANMAADSSEDARAMRQIVEENDSNMQQCILATSQVADTIQSSSRTISELGVAIRNIDSIANTIKEIAEQTNLLALNAAIEAARAGEQGRGFAVVADEVRKLAERTANSTKDISRTIEEIGAISETAVRSMSGAVSEVGIGIDLIRKNGDGLKEIMGATRKVAGRVENISSASKEQANGSQRMAESLDRISSLVDSNAQSANEARVEAQELARSAKGLRTAGYPLTKCAI